MKWIKDLNVRPNIMKFLAGNIDKTPFNINCSNIFLLPLSRVMEIKKKKKELIKFLHSKGNNKQKEKIIH